MKRFLVTLFVFTFVFAGTAQDVFPDFEKNREVYFKFEIQEFKEIEYLTKIISIDNRDGNTIFAYANEKEFYKFHELDYDYKMLPHPNEGFNPTMATFEQIQNSDALESYPTYDAYVTLMYQFEADYPLLCDVFSIGTTNNGKDLLVAKISDNVNTDEAEPEFLYTSSMHGDELAAYPLMLNLIDSLLTSYGSVNRITNLVNGIEIYINPLANPDGTFGTNNIISSPTRSNANGIDLNRNYPDPDPDGGPHPDGNAWQVETIAFMDFAENRNFVAAANFHGGAEVCNYPWDTWSRRTADDAWWQVVCHEYADTAQAYSPSGYLSGFDDGITNGWDWYTTSGNRQDYMNYYHQCREFIMEISGVKLIPESELLPHWEYNKRSLLNYMEQSLFGVRGIVTDANSGLPVEAEVYVLNHEVDEDSSWVYSDLVTGNYHRLLIEGTYNIRFSAPCYEDQIIYGVSVINRSTTTLDIQLQPSIADFTASSSNVIVGEDVDFTDISCETASTWFWTFSGPGNGIFVNGTNENSQNPVVQFDANGNYNVSLTITGSFGSDTKTKVDYIHVTDCIYCPSTYSNVTDDWITNVTFNTINNNSGQGGSDSYEDFTSVSTEVEPGVTYPISITFEMNGDWHQDCFAFIDFNRDCDFDDTGESFDLGFQQNDGTLISSITIPSSIGPGAYIMRIVEQYNQDPGPCDSHPTVYGETEDYTLVVAHDDFELDLKVFLEGSYNGTEMNTDLTDLTILPLNQPYNTFPWNYTGTESVGSIPNSDVVDWILIELRDAPNAAAATSGTMVAQQACFLLNDGSIVDLDGSSNLQFDISISQQLFVVIWNRNHLAVMSANPLIDVAGIYIYDFTTSDSQAYNSGQKNIGGVYCMFGGDANADSIVNDLDKTGSWLTEAGLEGYLSSDLNFDGQSNNVDKNDMWQANYNEEGQVP